jgi:hypothetical protein
MLVTHHLDLASWVLAATFVLFIVTLAAAVITSWRESRRPPRQPGVLEAVFTLRRAGLIDGNLATLILERYDDVEEPAP